MNYKISVLSVVAVLTAIAPGSVLAQTSIDELLVEYQDNDLAQVTSVSQLSDVQPTDWAFQSLQSLVERYGCIAGYPDGTFRGNRAATRYEMAAALNACLDNISDKFATKEDLEAVKALQEEFQAELATLRGRVNSLEAQTETLEAQQFSTTTKLEGSVIITPQFGDQIDNRGVTSGSRLSVVSEVGLTLNTSFSGKDLLSTTLLTGNGGNDFFGAFFDDTPDGQPPFIIDFSLNEIVNPGAIEYRGTGAAVELDSLYYQFPIGDNLSITVGPQLYPSDFIDANSYANDPSVDFNSGFFINNALVINDAIDDPGGAGFGVDWNIDGGPVSVRAGYVAANAAEPVDSPLRLGEQGLFGASNTVLTELEYADEFSDNGNNFAVRLQYSYSKYSRPFISRSFLTGIPELGDISSEQHVLGANVEATFGKVGIFGRYGISLDPTFSLLTNTGFVIPVPFDELPGSNNLQTWMAGFGISDLIIPGSMLSIAGGQPLIQSVNSRTQTNLEGFFRLPVNDNLTISPGVMAIINPDNRNQDPIIQGVLRTTFSF